MLNSLDIQDFDVEYYFICEEQIDERLVDISYFCRLEEEHYPLLF